MADIRKKISEVKIPEDQQQMVENCSEAELYMFINSIGGMMFRGRHYGWMPHSEQISLQAQMENAARYVKRYTCADTVDENGLVTAHYWSWFRWWDKYVSGLSNEDWRKFEQLMNKYRDDNGFVSNTEPDFFKQWRPEGKWDDNLKEEIKSYNRQKKIQERAIELKKKDPEMDEWTARMAALNVIQKEENEAGLKNILKLLKETKEGKIKRTSLYNGNKMQSIQALMKAADMRDYEVRVLLSNHVKRGKIQNIEDKGRSLYCLVGE